MNGSVFDMRVLALDVGKKTIGVAVTDPLGMIAQGVGVILRSGINNDLVKLQELIKKYMVELIIVGLPKNMDGTIGNQGRKAVEFAKKLKKITDVPVKIWDERLTTVAAERILLEADLSRARRKKVIDKVAAVLILQNFLEAKRTAETLTKQ